MFSEIYARNYLVPLGVVILSNLKVFGTTGGGHFIKSEVSSTKI